MMSLKNIERKRNGLNVVQCFFYSAVACLIPFLNSHMREIGITKLQSAWITAIVAIISMLGPLCLGPIAYKYNKYKSLLVFLLLLSFFAYTGLLLVPRVIRTERQPKIYFDCTSGLLRIEQCPNWHGQCHTYPKRPATNFSNFQLTSCTYECPQIGTLNMSWYPVHVCFTGNSNDEGNLCLVQNHPEQIEVKNSQSDQMTDEPSSRSTSKNLIQFDTRFDRWPVIEGDQDDIIERIFNGQPVCTYQPAPPLIVNQKLFDDLQCRPFVQHCSVYCSINLQHRRKWRANKEGTMRPPAACSIETGNAQYTIFSYLAIRVVADLSLFTAYTLLDALSIALTNDFDNIYGGFSKLWSIMIPMIAWPPICGQLVDYFSTPSHPNYAPPIIVFDGLALITIFMIVALPLSPTGLIAKSASQTIGQNAPFVKTQPYPRQHNKRSALARLTLLFPLILILGTMWGLLNTFLHPFYLDMGLTKMWLGLTYTETFLSAAPFMYIAKSLINGVGRVHLIVLAFIFYALRFGGISYLLYPQWLVVPFEMMESFSLPIAWVGITSYCHHLIKRSPNAASFASGAVFQKSSPHLLLQYSLNLVHFGGGRALGAIIGGVWMSLWPEYNSLWFWLSDPDIDYENNHNDLDDGFRILLRLFSISSAVIGVLFFITYNCCCRKRVKVTETRPPEEGSSIVLNGTYTKLKNNLEQQAIQLQQKPTQTQANQTDPKKTVNGESKIRMADDEATDDETPLTK